jgi:hypothetical protein
MMFKAAAKGAAHGSARGFAWGSVLVAAVVVFLQWVFGG